MMSEALAASVSEEKEEMSEENINIEKMELKCSNRIRFKEIKYLIELSLDNTKWWEMIDRGYILLDECKITEKNIGLGLMGKQIINWLFPKSVTQNYFSKTEKQEITHMDVNLNDNDNVNDNENDEWLYEEGKLRAQFYLFIFFFVCVCVCVCFFVCLFVCFVLFFLFDRSLERTLGPTEISRV